MILVSVFSSMDYEFSSCIFYNYVSKLVCSQTWRVSFPWDVDPPHGCAVGSDEAHRYHNDTPYPVFGQRRTKSRRELFLVSIVVKILGSCNDGLQT